VGSELHVGQVEYAGSGGQVTKWQRASTPDELRAVIDKWDQFGTLAESLTSEDIQHLTSGGFLYVQTGEYGIVLRHADTPLSFHNWLHLLWSKESGE
jgi:hypothetical protein